MKHRKSWLALGAVVLLLAGTTGCNVVDRLKARDMLNRGVSAYENKRFDQAAEHFEEAIRLDPDLLTAYLYLATTHRAQFIPQVRSAENIALAKKAIAAFEEVLTMDPNNATAMANIAMIYAGLDEHDRAKDWHRRQAEVQPDNPDPWYGIGVVNWELAHRKTGDKGERVEELEEEEVEELVRLVEEGVEALQKALEIRPDYTDAMQYLNLMYREFAKLSDEEEERKKWRREADQLALQALELRRKQEAEAEKKRQKLFGQ